ncbi:MAG: SlyX family protein [Gallionella sp.]|nr:SlyX family protein [Gallionella sp.]
MSDERIEKIETKLAYQEDLIEELNKSVYRQQQKLDRLEATCHALAQHIASQAESVKDGQISHERPPHY